MSNPDTLRNLMDELVEAEASPKIMAIVSSIIAVCLMSSGPKTGAQRVREFRDRKREERNECNECNDSVTAKEKVAPKENNTPDYPSGNLPPQRKSDRGTRLPEPWTPPENLWSLAQSEGFAPDELRLETKKFRDHFWAVPGPKGRKLDWGRTWMNWVRNSRNFTKKTAQVVSFRASSPKRSYAEIKAEQRQGTGE